MTTKNAKQTGTVRAGETASAVSNGHGIILPRYLRKPARHFHRLLNGGFKITTKGVAWSMLAVGVVGIGSYLNTEGNTDALLSKLAPSLGVSVSRFDISGNMEVADLAIGNLLVRDNGKSLLTYDVEKARQLLNEVSWIAEAKVSKVYPNRLAVEIIERTPFALWQGEDGLKLIDREGRVLGAFDGRANNLPLVVGKGAAETAAPVLASIQKFQFIVDNFNALIRVGERRWDIELKSGALVLLPEVGIEDELARFAQLEEENSILAKDIVQIDLRIADRMTLKLSNDAAASVKAAKDALMEAAAKSQKEREI